MYKKPNEQAYLNINRFNAKSTLYNSPSFKEIDTSPVGKKINPNKLFNQTIMINNRNNSNMAGGGGIRGGMRIDESVRKNTKNSPNLKVRMAFGNNTLYGGDTTASGYD